MRKGIKRSSSIFEDDKDEKEERVKITVFEEETSITPQEEIAKEEKVFKIPAPQKNSFLLKAIQKEGNLVAAPTDEVISEGELEKKAKDWLKSLGWREGQAVGKNSQERPVSPVMMLVSRPQFLGLGAKPDSESAKVYVDKTGKEVHSVGIDERLNLYKADACVEIKGGIHKGLTGEIIGKDEAGALIKMDLSGVVVQVSKDELSGKSSSECSYLKEAKIGLVVRIITHNGDYFKTGQVMDVLSEDAIIVKCQSRLVQLPPSKLLPISPNSASQRVYITSKGKTGTVHYLDSQMCTVQEDEEKNFLSVSIEDCCLIVE
jgi:hypothetical protein